MAHTPLCTTFADLADRGGSAPVLSTLADVQAACKAVRPGRGEPWLRLRLLSSHVACVQELVQTQQHLVASAEPGGGQACAILAWPAVRQQLKLSSLACTAASCALGLTVVATFLTIPQEHCCFVDVHGTIVTQADQIAAAISTAASSQPSSNGTLQLLEADHVFNPEKQDAPGQDHSHQPARPLTDCTLVFLELCVVKTAADCPMPTHHPPNGIAMASLAQQASTSTGRLCVCVYLQELCWLCCTPALAATAGQPCTQP